MHRPIRRATSLLPALLSTGLAGCPGESAGPDAPATGPSTTGSPTSFPLTEPDEPTTTSGAPETTGGDGESTTGADTGTTEPAPICGNSVVEPGEGCDLGPANDPYAACTDECQPNVCGDGHVFAGVEGCDQGPANVDTGYCRTDCNLNVCGDGHVFTGIEECDSGESNGQIYGACDPACTVNRCGDGQLDVPHEQSDAGVQNGSGVPGEDGVAACDDLCGFSGRRLFVSSKLFDGDLGTRAGADLACQVMAGDVEFPAPHKYRALLADSQGSPNTLFAADTSDLPFISPAGLVLAPDYPTLIALGPTSGVATTETGEAVVDKKIWTNVGPFGDAFLTAPDDTCADWTSADFAKSARVGRNAVGPDLLEDWQAGHQWLSFKTEPCHKSYRIYCIEAP